MYYGQDRICPSVRRDSTIFQLISINAFISQFLNVLFIYFSTVLGVTLALLKCDLCFAYFSTPSLKIAVHVDNLLLQTLFDLFLSDLRNFPGQSVTVSVLCYHQLKFKLSNRNLLL